MLEHLKVSRYENIYKEQNIKETENSQSLSCLEGIKQMYHNLLHFTDCVVFVGKYISCKFLVLFHVG